jgi:hypothetical protein
MRTQSADTSPEAEQVLIALLRQASVTRKVEMVANANRTLRELSLAGLRERHPGESAAQLRRRWADLWLGSDLAAKVYGN